MHTVQNMVPGVGFIHPLLWAQELVRGLKMVNAFKGTEFTGAMALTADGTRRTDDIDAACVSLPPGKTQENSRKKAAQHRGRINAARGSGRPNKCRQFGDGRKLGKMLKGKDRRGFVQGVRLWPHFPARPSAVRVCACSLALHGSAHTSTHLCSVSPMKWTIQKRDG